MLVLLSACFYLVWSLSWFEILCGLLFFLWIIFRTAEVPIKCASRIVLELGCPQYFCCSSSLSNLSISILLLRVEIVDFLLYCNQHSVKHWSLKRICWCCESVLDRFHLFFTVFSEFCLILVKHFVILWLIFILVYHDNWGIEILSCL